MEKIGDFAKRCQTTIKTLRYYDQLGLLPPDYIDTISGYRYYSPKKVEQMHQIIELKEIGLTLSEIKQYCDAETDNERNQIMEEKRHLLTKLVKDTSYKLAKLENLRQNLKKGMEIMNIDINSPFENDERVIGHWEFIATIDKKEDFIIGNKYDNETIYEELYFLPNGEPYWGFSWTKGYIKVTFNDGIVIPYELNEINGQLFMFVNYPSYGGIWVLRQTDTKQYTVASIAKQDNINLPFSDDLQIHGQWSSIDYVKCIEDFNPLSQQTSPYNIGLKSIEFFPDGVFEWTWQSKYKHRWTKDTALITWWNNDKITHTTAPSYEIHIINNIEYLFFQHKSGDYTWGKMKPGYFVMKRGKTTPLPTIHFNMPFENDESIIGCWKMVATLSRKEDFIPSKTYHNDSYHYIIYFLPNGKWYWVFSWTKGYLKVSGGENKLCPYTIKVINNQRYMFVEYENNFNLRPIWVLKQIDNKAYTSYEIGQWDNINLDFINDSSAHGIWTSVDFVDNINIFNPDKYTVDYTLWLQTIEFLPDGRLHKRYNEQESIQKSHWTKGFLLERFGEGSIAPSYTIQTINETDYLFLEWKTGDYVWGKIKPSYYVFKRGN